MIIKVNPVENIIAANAASDRSMQKLTPSLTYYEKFQSDETWKNRELHISESNYMHLMDHPSQMIPF